MAHSDPISDLLTRIRNGKEAKHRFIDLVLTKMNLSIIEVLKKNGYVNNYLVNEDKYKVRVFLRYNMKTREPTIQGLKRISRPGQKRYIGYREVPDVLSGLGIAILSTPKGVMDGHKARQEKVGGELLCYVW